VTGAAFHRGRLLLAGSQGTTYQVWSVNVTTGKRRLELELPNVHGESEGLTQVQLLGGRLHYLVAPLPPGQPTFGPSVGLLHFTTGRWAGRGLRVTSRSPDATSLTPTVNVTVRRHGHAVEGARVSVAGFRATTNRRGRATVRPKLGVAGNFAALASKGRPALRGPLEVRAVRAGDGGGICYSRRPLSAANYGIEGRPQQGLVDLCTEVST
jgi:hypothetical protein